MTGTFWAILPPVIAIVLALITKEVYLSLMIGIASGALMYHNFHRETKDIYYHLLCSAYLPQRYLSENRRFSPKQRLSNNRRSILRNPPYSDFRQTRR